MQRDDHQGTAPDYLLPYLLGGRRGQPHPEMPAEKAEGEEVTSAELAKVREVTSPNREFYVGTEFGNEAPVTYHAECDELYCHRHRKIDDCTCASRVRLSGVLTNSVVQDVKHWKEKTV